MFLENEIYCSIVKEINLWVEQQEGEPNLKPLLTFHESGSEWKHSRSELFFFGF